MLGTGLALHPEMVSPRSPRYPCGGDIIPEMRKHYFLDKYCIVAAERRKRPSDFVVAKPAPSDTSTCPFCPGHEDRTPPAVAVYKDGETFSDSEADNIKDWDIRVIPNLFAAAVPSPTPPTGQWIALPGFGYHEVMVDSMDHFASAADFSLKHMELLLRVYRDRYVHYRYMDGINYVSIFKNKGPESGATLEHSHSQVVALPIIPPIMKQEISAIMDASFCLYCNVADREMASDRLIAKNDSWILISPFYSQSPYEMWIIPRTHLSNLEDLNQEQMKGLAALLRDALRKMKALLDDPPFNYMFYQLPYDYHINIRIQPAVTKIAGLEKSTGVYIVPVPPEDAASELRQA